MTPDSPNPVSLGQPKHEKGMRWVDRTHVWLEMAGQVFQGPKRLKKQWCEMPEEQGQRMNQKAVLSYARVLFPHLCNG